MNDKLKDNEKHVELLKMELAKWQEEANELNLKCQTYENQLEQKQFEHRNQIMSKDVHFLFVFKLFCSYKS